MHGLNNLAGVHHMLAQGGLEAFPQGGTERSRPRARIHDNRYTFLDLKKTSISKWVGEPDWTIVIKHQPMD